ncbi:hypothetical protein [Kitasatospora sp. NPDC057198]|uniref:hypothetical protein n=1 Tax=Kitasatospora sp. NPDC057198 TaxID=3346046 RepID=UPI0036432BEE
MTIQPLHQQLLSQFDADTQTVEFLFPPVPQGLIWTGSISVSFPQGHDPQGISWTLYRSGTPFLSAFEWPVFRDVQAVGQEQLRLVGVYLGAQDPPSYQITASWDGFSAAGWTDGGGVSPASPTVDNSTRGFVQVYNTLGVGSQLEVMADPLSYNVLQDYYELLTPAGGTGNIIPAVPATKYLQIWEIELQVSAAQLAAVAGVQSVTAHVQSSDGNIIELCTVKTVPGTTAHQRVHMAMHGFNIGAGKTMQVVAGAYGGSDVRVCATVVYELKTL